jgi:peptidyl-prolyl cis-trans isomerase C
MIVKPLITLKVSARVLLLLLGLAGLAACGKGEQTPTATSSSSLTPPPSTITPTSFQPSATPPPLVAKVNGEEITQPEYEAELARYQASVGTNLAPNDKQLVLNDMIDELLLSQGAAEAGFTPDDTVVQDHISRLGSEQALTDWIASHGYTEDSFRQDLARSIAAAWMRDQIIAEVPETADQVHARQILLYNSDQATEALNQLRSGKDFADLAAQYDPVTNGDLGWFPRGYLLEPELEEAAFNLQPNETSDVIKTNTGYHILQVIERDPQHPLTPDARRVLQSKALQNWLAQRRNQSEIQVLLP